MNLFINFFFFWLLGAPLTMLPLYKYAQLERLGSIFVEIHLHDAFLPDSFTLLLSCYPVSQDHRNEHSHSLRNFLYTEVKTKKNGELLKKKEKVKHFWY